MDTNPVIKKWITSDPIPTLLHVCHESREEALKIYQPSFGLPPQKGNNYIDFNHGIIYFGGIEGKGFSDLDTMLDSMGDQGDDVGVYLVDMFLSAEYGPRDAEKIQCMIVSIDEDRYGIRSFIWDEIRLFKGLQQLTVLVWEGGEEARVLRLMRMYRATLCTVAGKYPEWVIPAITVISAETKTVWGHIDATTPAEELVSIA